MEAAFSEVAVAEAASVPRQEWRAFQTYREALTVGWEARTGRRRVDLLFLGDSLTELWLHPLGGRSVFANEFGRWHPAAFGVGGDQVAHLRWRIERGILDGLAPQVTVLCIGANQLARRFDARETARAIGQLVDEVLARLPGTHVLLSSVLPQNPGWEWDVLPKIRVVNDSLRKLGRPRTTFIDATPHFADARGIHASLFRDGVHLSRDGYRVWADVLRPNLDALLPGDAPGGDWRMQGNGAVRIHLRDLRNRLALGGRR